MDLFGEITLEELQKALKSTTSGKEPALDGIPADILKKGANQLHKALLSLYNACLRKGQVPQDFRDALSL